MSKFVFEAQARQDLGKGASRRLRRGNVYIPAIVYGGDKQPQPIALDKREFYRALETDERIYTSVLTLNIDGVEEQVMMKDLQRHPFKPVSLHVDFLRVDENTKVTVNVPVHFINEEKCVGVKTQGGKLQRLLNEVELVGTPGSIPEYLEVDLANITAGQILHLSDLNLPEGTQVAALLQGEDHNAGVVSVSSPRGKKAE